MHGGGNGYYTPIAGAPSAGFTRRPEYFGMKFAQRYVGSRLVGTNLVGADLRVSAFAFERSEDVELVLINKSNQVLRCALPSGISASPSVRLSAPAIDAKEGVELESLHVRHRSIAIVAPFTAIAFRVKGTKVEDITETGGR